MDLDLIDEGKALNGETVVTRRRLRTKASSKGCLVKIYPPEVGEGLLTLPTERFIIGRERDCHLVLATDSAVSRMHAAIESRGGQHYLVDMGSTNGTYVNDELATERALCTGDQIRVGAHILKYLCDDVEAQFHETIYAMMVTDGLTGCRTKKFFEEALERELVRSQRHARPLALVMLDVDHFKRVNDTHTHLVGDEALRLICARLAPEIRKDEVFARWGGEEFAILLPEATRDQALSFAERLRASVADQPLAIGQLVLPVTISLGVGWTDGTFAAEPQGLLREADSNLLAAKQAGRNHVVG